MSGCDDWHPIDNLFCDLVDLLGSTKPGLRALDEAIKKGELRTARYPASGPGNRWKRAVECPPEWWRGRRLLSGGEILRWTEPDGETEDWDWRIVVCPEDAATLWPRLASAGMDPKTWIVHAIEHRRPDERNVTQFANRVAPEMKAATAAGECTKAWTVKTIINRIAEYKLWS